MATLVPSKSLYKIQIQYTGVGLLDYIWEKTYKVSMFQGHVANKGPISQNTSYWYRNDNNDTGEWNGDNIMICNDNGDIEYFGSFLQNKKNGYGLQFKRN